MFTSQATIERRAKKEARLHTIEGRLETLESAAAIVASVADAKSSEDVSGMKAELNVLTERLSGFKYDEFLAAYSKRLETLEAALKCDDVTKRLDGLEAASAKSDYVAQLVKRLDELEAANKEAAKATQERFAEIAESVRKVQVSLENIKQESEEALKSLEKKLTAKPMFQAKSNSSTNNKS